MSRCVSCWQKLVTVRTPLAYLRKTTMECADLRAALLSGQTPRGPEVEAHARSCEACAELLAQDMVLGRRLAGLAREAARGSEGDQVPDFARVTKAIVAERSASGWLRSRTTLARVSLLLLAVL